MQICSILLMLGCLSLTKTPLLAGAAPASELKDAMIAEQVDSIVASVQGGSYVQHNPPSKRMPRGQWRNCTMLPHIGVGAISSKHTPTAFFDALSVDHFKSALVDLFESAFIHNPLAGADAQPYVCYSTKGKLHVSGEDICVRWSESLDAVAISKRTQLAMIDFMLATCPQDGEFSSSKFSIRNRHGIPVPWSTICISNSPYLECHADVEFCGKEIAVQNALPENEFFVHPPTRTSTSSSAAATYVHHPHNEPYLPAIQDDAS